MTQTNLETKSANPYATLLLFEWGDANEARYTRWTSDISYGGNTYLSEPSIKIETEKPLGGTVEDNPVTIQMTFARSPLDTLILPYRHAKVEVTVAEIVPGDNTTYRVRFKGQVHRAVVRPGGVAGIVRLEVAGPKASLSVLSGMKALTTCQWAFGSCECGYPVEDADETATISALNVDGLANRITITPDGAPDLSNDRYARGQIIVDGLALTIRKSFEDGTFDMRDAIPPYWADQACVLRIGCKKTIEACRFWDRESQFSGVGYALPARHPLIESE